jgi:hypothetical protein
MSTSEYGIGPIDVGGAAFDDFRLTDRMRTEDSPAAIERDRPIMAARPGFERKLLPLRLEPETGTAFAGGRYLFDTYENAVAFADWCANEFALDGVLILDRPAFADVTTSVWRVIGAHDFQDVRDRQKVYRTEIWTLAGPAAADRVAGDWARVRDEAQALVRASLWLLHDDAANRICTVTVSDRLAPPSEGPDFGSVRALETAPSLGAAWERAGLVADKAFDRTHWVFTVWFPTRAGGPFPEAVWPNSPPLPAPDPVAAGVA